MPERSAREKMVAGEPYLVPDPELDRLGTEARQKLKVFNDTPRSDPAGRIKALGALVGRMSLGAWIETPFLTDYGVNIQLGDCYINMNCTFLDSAPIVIGNFVAIGPNVQLITATHPVDVAERFIPYPNDAAIPMRVVCLAKPITIEDGVWLGAGVIVLPGVTIGRGSMVGAGSVVTKSVPAWSVAVGNPARVIRELAPNPGLLQTPPGKA
jgi:acetyltransferase-like isoleucine patch superfamily enzyme